MSCEGLPDGRWCSGGWHFRANPAYPTARQMSLAVEQCRSQEQSWERNAEMVADFERRVVQGVSEAKGAERKAAIKAAVQRRLEGG